MIKGKVFFHPIEGSASLTISWSSTPKGDAVEATQGNGVGFFSFKGDLLSVIFDEVCAENDHQVLEFKHHQIEIQVRKGKVTYTLEKTRPTTQPRKKVSTQKKRKIRNPQKHRTR